MRIFCLAIFLFFHTALASTERAAQAAKVDVSKSQAIDSKDTMKVVNKVLNENLKPQTAAVVSKVAEKALKEADHKPGREPEDKVATEQGTSLSDRADAEVKKNVPEEVIACGAKQACDGKPKCPCEEKTVEEGEKTEGEQAAEKSAEGVEKKEGENAAEKPAEKHEQHKETEKKAGG